MSWVILLHNVGLYAAGEDLFFELFKIDHHLIDSCLHFGDTFSLLLQFLLLVLTPAIDSFNSLEMLLQTAKKADGHRLEHLQHVALKHFLYFMQFMILTCLHQQFKLTNNTVIRLPNTN